MPVNTTVTASDTLAGFTEGTGYAQGLVSAWKITGLLTGNDGVYRFVGGTPLPALVAQDSGASGWTVAVSISGSQLVVTVTGASGTVIRWNAVAKLVEVAS